jgi:hypothetical protein
MASSRFRVDGDPISTTLLDLRDRAEHAIDVGHDLDIDVDGALAPPVEDRSRASGQVDPGRAVRLAAQRLHEPLNANGVG